MMKHVCVRKAISTPSLAEQLQSPKPDVAASSETLPPPSSLPIPNSSSLALSQAKEQVKPDDPSPRKVPSKPPRSRAASLARPLSFPGPSRSRSLPPVRPELPRWSLTEDQQAQIDAFGLRICRQVEPAVFELFSPTADEKSGEEEVIVILPRAPVASRRFHRNVQRLANPKVRTGAARQIGMKKNCDAFSAPTGYNKYLSVSTNGL